MATAVSALGARVTEGSAAAPDSGARIERAWVSLPVEEIDRPEQLDREPRGAAISLRCDAKDGRVVLRRASGALVRGASRIDVDLARDAAGRAASAVIAGRRRTQLAAGRLGLRGGPVLLEEWIGTRTPSSRVPPTARQLVSFEGTAGGSRAIEGVGLRGEATAGGTARGAWLVAGRRVEDGARGAATVAWGARAATRRSMLSGAAGLLRDLETGRTTAAASLGGTWRRVGTRGGPGVSAEAAIGPRGVSMLLQAWSATGPLEASLRWRGRAGAVRPTAGEATLEAGPRRARARLRMSGGPSGSSGSVSRLEVECRLAAPIPAALRAGETRWDQPPPVGPAEAGAKRERFWVLEATVSRARGRTLSIQASRRLRSLPTGWREGSGLGGSVGLSGRRARLEVLIQAIRATAGGSAWGSALYASGSTALRSWSTSGLWAAGRGVLRLGRWAAGAVVESREDAAGKTAAAASFWIQRTLPAAAR